MCIACLSGSVLTSIILNLALVAFLAMSFSASLAEMLICMYIISRVLKEPKKSWHDPVRRETTQLSCWYRPPEQQYPERHKLLITNNCGLKS